MSSSSHAGIGRFLRRIHPLWLVPVYYGTFLIANRLALLVEQTWGCDCRVSWPMMMFPGPISPRRLAVAGLVFLFVLVGGFLIVRSRSLLVVLLVSAVFLLLANAIWGWWVGFVMPLDSWGNKLYTDALGVESVGAFLSRFNERQLGLTVHGRTHPPGAVLLFYLLLQVTENPGFQAMMIALASLWISQLCFFGTGRRLGIDRETCVFGVALLGVVPSVGIYYLVSLDAVVGTLSFLLLYLLVRDGGYLRGGIIVLTVVSGLLLHFPALFFLPVLLFAEYFLHGRAVRPLVLLGLAAGCLILLYVGWGFNWLESFRVASRLENPRGFLLLVEPLNYVLTRLESLAEFILFLGPAVGYFVVRGLRSVEGKTEASKLFWIGVGTFLAMLLAGTYQTAEVARGAIFVLPFAILPFLGGFPRTGRVTGSRAWLVGFVLTAGQTVIMQLIGIYIY